MTKRCGHFNGRASMSRCERECLPLMAVCVEHATPDAIVMAMRQLVQERDKALAEVRCGCPAEVAQLRRRLTHATTECFRLREQSRRS